jgi:hypothetical protein
MLIGASLLMIIGFIAVNAYFIGKIVSLKDHLQRVEMYNTLRYLGMASWIGIVIWFFVVVLMFYVKSSGRLYKSKQHK